MKFRDNVCEEEVILFIRSGIEKFVESVEGNIKFYQFIDLFFYKPDYWPEYNIIEHPVKG